MDNQLELNLDDIDALKIEKKKIDDLTKTIQDMQVEVYTYMFKQLTKQQQNKVLEMQNKIDNFIKLKITVIHT